MYPPLRQRFLRNNQFGHSRCIVLVPGVHDLCRYPTSFVQIPYFICVGCVLRDLFLKAYYIHAMYPLCHIKLFQRLILFGIMFLIKGGIYTNNVPPLATKILVKQPIWSFPLHCACPRGARSVQIPYIICVGCVLRDLFLKAYYIREMYHYAIFNYFRG